MTQSNNDATFFCENCNEFIEGNANAKTHYQNCTMHIDDSDKENLYGSSSINDDIRELLISEVFCKEPLWNTLLPYSERSYKITSTLWSEIDITLGVPNGYSQKTFGSLKDRFVKLLAEESKSKRSGSAASSKIEWKYFTQLNFLRPSVEYRPTTSNLSKKKRSTEALEESCAPIPKKKSMRVESAGSSTKDLEPFLTKDFDSFLTKKIESTMPDRIGSFMLYLESEMRALSNQAVQTLIRKITEALIHVQDELIM